MGSVAALVRTFGVGASVVAPTVSIMDWPWPQVFLMSLATFTFSLTWFLPAPGQHLPTYEKTSEADAVMIDKQSNAPTHSCMDEQANLTQPMTNYALHQSSFRETYTERSLNVSRPQLIDTGLDPDFYLQETAGLTAPKDMNNVSAMMKVWEEQSHEKSNKYFDGIVSSTPEKN